MSRRYGLIGRNLSHSFSPDYFEKKFREENSTDSYTAFPLAEISDLPVLLNTHPDLDGLNVTIPFKESVLPFLDEISPDAAAIGAVNCIRISRKNGKHFLSGYNTDWLAFLETIPEQILLEKSPALVLGTGGAAKAVCYALQQAGIPFTSVSRTPNKEEEISWQELQPDRVRGEIFLINTTPLGMHPDTASLPPLPYDAITTGHVLYDLVYNPPTTRFLQEGAARGATTRNGYEMLCRQADASLRIWRDS